VVVAVLPIRLGLLVTAVREVAVVVTVILVVVRVLVILMV
jgi:hypothetical protein